MFSLKGRERNRSLPQNCQYSCIVGRRTVFPPSPDREFPATLPTCSPARHTRIYSRYGETCIQIVCTNPPDASRTGMSLRQYLMITIYFMHTLLIDKILNI